MTKKQLNTEQMVNELKGQSVFFREPAAAPPTVQTEPAQIKDSHPPTEEGQPLPPTPGQENVGTESGENVNKEVSKQENKQTSKHVNKFTSKQAYVEAFLKDKAFVTASFRVPPELMRKFDEVFYLANSRYGSDFKKYAVVVAALALLFWDFEKNGKESELYKLLISGTEK